MNNDELLVAALPIAAALIARIPADENNNGLTDATITSAILQSVSALRSAQQQMPQQDSFWAGGGSTAVE